MSHATEVYQCKIPPKLANMKESKTIMFSAPIVVQVLITVSAETLTD